MLQSGTSLSAAQLAEELGVSRRTLFRDLNMLEAAGIPYYHRPEKGYGINADFFLPPMNLQVTEALGLMLLAKNAATQRGQPLAPEGVEAVRKLVTLLPDPIREVCVQMMGNVTVRPHSTAHVKRDAEWYCLLHQAIDQRCIVQMRYDSLFDGGVIDMKLHPYHLHFAVRAWYVIGYSVRHRQVRTFKLARIDDLQLSGSHFTPRRGFSVEQHFGKAWSMIPEGKVHRVELEFTAKVGRNVAEVRWHPTQQQRLLQDGRCEMQFEVDGLGEIAWWLLGYGDQVVVRRPAALRRRLQQVYASALARYDTAAPPAGRRSRRTRKGAK